MGQDSGGSEGRSGLDAARRLARPFTELVARLRGGGAEALDRQRLAAVLELNRALVAALDDRRAMLQRLLDEAVRTFGAERGFLVRVERDGGLVEGDTSDVAWRVELGRSFEREGVQKPERKVSSTVVEQVLVQRTGLFVEDAQVAGGELSGARSIADMQLRSVLCMPLVAAAAVGGRIIACLYLDHRFRSGAFQPQDLPWFQVFADQALIALHLVERLEQQRALTEAERERSNALEAKVVETEHRLDEVRSDLARERLRDGGRGYEEFVGHSAALLRCLHLVDRVATGSGAFSVLVVGESGVGKELVARALHTNGSRKSRPFVAVNAAAVSPDLLESELFGHVRGAFTGAERDRPGLVREADGGVLFLDEVTECDLEMQAKLLRLLENGEVRAVGGDRTERVDVRVVAATNRNPSTAVREGRLREDLYYRLAVVTIPVPALRDRLEDLPELVDHFFARAAAARGNAAVPRRPNRELLAALRRRAWPGNLRELKNEIVRLDALATTDEVGAELLQAGAPAAHGVLPTLDLAALESAAIDAALQAADGNKSEAARLLGISRRALYNKLERR